MPRYVRMLEEGLRSRGHTVTVWSPRARAHRLPAPGGLKKWMGYIDQYVIFPLEIRRRLETYSKGTLFVFADQAQGPWVPLVRNRRHIIHCHDFLALRSASGEFPENPTGWSGRQYQAMIARGFSKGRFFLSVSTKTREDLHSFLPYPPALSEVVYNGLNYPFKPLSPSTSTLALKDLKAPANGFILHIGGNQWYKNRNGVLEIYAQYVRSIENPLPLWMIGAKPSASLEALAAAAGGQVSFLKGLNDEQVNAAYSRANALLFPSLEEGFGWPIAEAMASGCPVITTGHAPMTEVGRDAAFYIPRRPFGQTSSAEVQQWANKGAAELCRVLSLQESELKERLARGQERVRDLTAEKALDGYEAVYQKVLN